MCDRKRNILIESDVSNGDVKELSGKGECKSADGCSSFCCFAQPFLVCCEEKTLFVIDRATLTVRIITSLKPLINYLLMKFDLSCLLTLVCEHHSSVARAKYPMPTPYQYSTDAILIMKESMKKKTDSGYLYVHIQDQSILFPREA